MNAYDDDFDRTTPSSSRVGEVPNHTSAWGAISSAALAGFGVTILLATLGVALGLSAGAGAIDHATDAEGTAKAFGAGAMIWLALSAILVGVTAGGVLACTARETRPYEPGTWGLVAWAVGLTLAAVVGSASSAGMGAFGGAAGGQLADRAAVRSLDDGRTSANDRAIDRAIDRTNAQSGTMDATTRERAADAAKATALGAWAAVIAQIIGLVATIVAAKAFRKKIMERWTSASNVQTPRTPHAPTIRPSMT